MNKMCSVLVTSCDKYSDTWYPFFSLLNIYWKDCPYDIYLNTEELGFDFEGLKINIINHSKTMPWSDRLIDSLKKINTKYVIFLLDDFFINDFVVQNKINQCISWLEENEEIATFSFDNTLWKDIDDKLYEGFELRPIYGYYRFNTQAAIWRKEDLLKILRKNETPWQGEEFGTLRSFIFMRNKKFYTAKKNIKKVFSYSYNGAIYRGKWIPNIPEFLKSHDIDSVDYNLRSIGEFPEKYICLDSNNIMSKKEIMFGGLYYIFVKSGLKKIRDCILNKRSNC